MRLALPLIAAVAYLLYRSRTGRRLPFGRADKRQALGALPRDDADSPNAGERLRSTHQGGAFAGLGAERGAPPPMLRSTDPQDDIVTGLPDFSRGA